MSDSTYFWSEADKELLKKAYSEGEGLTGAAKLIPHKSRSTLAAQASRMKLTVPRPRKTKLSPLTLTSGSCGFGAPEPPGTSGTCSLG